MERALHEQLKEKQEMEKRLQKQAKTMDYLERAKREEATPLIEAAFAKRLVEEKVLHEREQQVHLADMFVSFVRLVELYYILFSSGFYLLFVFLSCSYPSSAHVSYHLSCALFILIELALF